MVNWNTGSVADEVFNFFDNVPLGISGALIPMVERKIVRVEQFTGDTIGTTVITPIYQDPILYLTLADVGRAIKAVGADVQSFRLGPFNMNKGAGSSIAEDINFWESEAKRIMFEELGYNSKFEQSFG